MRIHWHSMVKSWLFLPVAASVAVCSAAQARVFWGVAYSPYRADQTPSGGPQPTIEQIQADMPRLATLADNVRTYSVAGPQERIPTLANKVGMKTWLGGWIGPVKTKADRAKNQKEVARLIAASVQPGVAAVIVGNEALSRGDVSEAQLLAYIHEVKRRVHVPVAYCDAWQALLHRPRVVATTDLILANIHPWWEGAAAGEGSATVLRHVQELKARYPSKRVYIGEVGWPDRGPFGNTRATPENQALFINDFLSQAKGQAIPYFVCEAFDQRYKIEAGSTIGQSWGVLASDGSTKDALVGTLPAVAEDPARLAAAGKILTDGKLSPGLDMGVDTSEHKRDWVKKANGALDMAYPVNQSWGAVFIMVTKPTSDKTKRGTLDFSKFSDLAVELKATAPGAVGVGVKTAEDADDGSEPKHTIANIPQAWTTFRIPLTDLVDADHPISRMKELYVVTEFVFNGPQACTLSVKNVRFEPVAPPPPPAKCQAGSVSSGAELCPDFDMGVNTSDGRADWVKSDPSTGGIVCSYPDGPTWGAVFVTVGKPAPSGTKRKTKGFSNYKYLVLEMKGAKGGETVQIGCKTDQDPDDGGEPKKDTPKLTTDWQTIKIPLADLVDDPSYPASRFQSLYVVCELVFGAEAMTVSFRNVRFAN